MKKNIIKIAALAIASAFALPAYADVAIHQNVSLYGYAAGSVQYSKFGYDGAKSDTTMDIDAAKIGFAFNFAPVTAKVSFHSPAGADEINVLEANVTYDLGNGVSITGGRYQSSIGFEAFDIPNTSFITYGLASNYDWLIPAFTEGVKVNYEFSKFAASLSVVNTIYGGDYFRGDGSLSDGYGVEANLRYVDGAFSASATLAYDKHKGNFETYVADVWAQYVLNAKTTFGAEVLYYHEKYEGIDTKYDVYYGLVMAKQKLSDKFALAGRVSAGNDKFGSYKGAFYKASVVPSYAVTANLEVRAEVSYTKYGKELKDEPKNQVFAGVQAIFKF